MPTTLPHIDPAEIAARVAAARKDYAGKRSLDEIATPEEIANGSPFSFELWACALELQKARLALGLSVDDIAASSKLPADELRAFEDGATNPGYRVLARYAVAVGYRLQIAVGPKM